MSQAPARGFASDNSATVHPQVLAAIADVNVGHAFGYFVAPDATATKYVNDHGRFDVRDRICEYSYAVDKDGRPMAAPPMPSGLT